MKGFTTKFQSFHATDEWYTPRKAVEIIVPYVSKKSTIWCPFDKEYSEFVQVFRGGVDIRLFVLILMTARIFSLMNLMNTMTALYQIHHTVRKIQFIRGVFSWENRLVCWLA